MVNREIKISLNLTNAENERLCFLMERLDKTKSDLIRYAIKNLYNEVKG